MYTYYEMPCNGGIQKEHRKSCMDWDVSRTEGFWICADDAVFASNEVVK